jgi:hypothetical protein
MIPPKECPQKRQTGFLLSPIIQETCVFFMNTAKKAVKFSKKVFSIGVFYDKIKKMNQHDREMRGGTNEE